MGKPMKPQQAEYVQDLSHELLTPLAIIRSKAEILIQSPNLQKEDLKNIDVILKTVERMSRLNKALILLSKMENNVYQDVKSIHINEVVSVALENFEDQIRIKKLQIRYKKSSPEFFESNPNLVEILVTNLIKNAVFHNVESGYIHIESNGESFLIENSAKQKADQDVFNRFVSTNTNTHSIGLGLSIVSKICDLLGFKIDYTSTESTFKCRISFT